MNNSHSELDVTTLLEQTTWLQALARGLVGDAQRAEELTQDTLLAAFEKPPRRAGEVSALRAWLSTVLRHQVFSSARGERHRAGREQGAARPERLPSVTEALERTELRKRVTEAVLELESPYREVVVLRYLEGLSTRQVAERTGASQQAVRTRLSRALDKLRARLDEEYGGDRRAWAVVLLPLARQAEPLAGAAASATSNMMLAKLLGGVALLAAVSMLTWAGLIRPESTASEPLSVPGEGTRQVVTAETAETAGLEREGGASPSPAASAQAVPGRESLGSRERDEPPTIELRVEQRPDDPGPGQFLHYDWREGGLLLGAPRRFALESAREQQDAYGYRGIGLLIADRDRSAFARWTAEITNRTLAVVLDDQVLMAARVVSELTQGTLHLERDPAGYSEAEVDDILTRLGFPRSTFKRYDFYGRVVESSDGTPIENPRIVVQDESLALRVLAEGLFLARVRSREARSLGVEVDGYAPVSVLLSPDHDTPERALIIDLQKLASLDVHVTDSAGAPVAGIYLHITTNRPRSFRRPRWAPTRSRLYGSEWEAVTSDTGSIRQPELPPETVLRLGLYRSREEQRAGESALLWHDLVLAPGEERSIELTRPTLRTLRGRVIGPGGEPRGGVQVQLVRGVLETSSPVALSAIEGASTQVQTDVAGRFVFEDVPEGACHVGVPLGTMVGDRVVGPLAGLSLPLRIDEETVSREVVLELLPALSLAGTVIDGEGHPVAGVEVVASAQESWAHVTTETDEGGGFLFLGLPDCRFSLGTGFTQAFGLGALDVHAGEREITLRLARCALQVTLAPAADASDGAVEVALYGASSRGAAVSSWMPGFHVGREDQLLIEELPGGTYDLVVRSLDGSVAVATGVELDLAQRTELQLDFTLGAPLDVRLEGDGAPGEYVVRHGRTVVATGHVRSDLRDTQLVPAGKLEVLLLDDSGAVRATRHIQTVAGSEARVVFAANE